MKMRVLFLFPLFLFLLSTLFAQNGRYASLDDFPEVKSSTLLVILYEDDELYNTNIQEIIEENWTFSPYQFVDTTELYEISKNKGDKEYSILVRNNAHRLVRRVNGTDKIQSNHLALYLLDTGSDMRNYTGKDALTHFQMKDVRNTMEYFHKLPAFIKYMQLYLRFVEEKKPTEDTHGKLLREFNNAHSDSLQSYTLLIEQGDVEDFISLEEIKTLYPYPIELVESASILTAVRGEAGDKAFLHLDPRLKYFTIMHASSGEILYRERTETSGELSKADFRKLGKAAGGRPESKSKKWKDKIRRFNRSKKSGN